jgi:hypothetical protein
MKRPGALTYVLGNPLAVIVLCSAGGYFVYEWWTAHGSGALALVVFVVAGYGVNASEQLSKYRQWQREWNAMEGRPPASFASSRSARTARLVVALVLWAGWGYFAITQSHDPGMQVPAVLFWLLTIVVAVAGVVRFLRSRKQPPMRATDLPVGLCLQVPGRSPAVGEAMAALPRYCSALLVH